VRRDRAEGVGRVIGFGVVVGLVTFQLALL
jgi:hypothetical protein